ncbi:MAG: PAS domain-containing protein, partial [Chroococcales cyanobacterium]
MTSEHLSSSDERYTLSSHEIPKATELRQAQISQLLEKMTDAFVALDSDFRYTYINSEAARLMKTKPEALLGKMVWEVFPQVANTEFEEKCRGAIANQVSTHFEYHHYAPPEYDGWFEIHAYPSQEGLAIFYRDITKRKNTEQALQKSEETLQRQLAEIEAIYQSAPVGLSFLDTDLRFIRINERLAEFNGVPTKDHIGRRVREVLPELADVAEEVLYPILETGEAKLNVEIHGETPAQPGIERVWLEHFLPLKNGDRILGISIVCEEITERKQAEIELRESGERFRTLADNIPQLAWMADETGWIFWYNKRWFDYTGTTLAEMQGGDWQKVHSPDHIERVVKKFSHCIEKGKIWEDTFPLRRYDGEYRWFLSRAIPIRNEEGQVLRWFGTNTDITERLQAEEERQELLERERLAREEAEAANRIKDEFLAVLSHELRSPLNPILGWAKLLQTRKFSEAKTAEALATIERNAKLQAELIEDLLDVSRILRGKLSLNITPVNLAATIQEAIETVRLAAEAKSISIQMRLKPNIGKVLGDAARLQQVIWNLLSNAVKFTPPGGQVEIELVELNASVEMTIRDTGKGIPPDFLPHVFDYFRQAEGGTTRHFGGLGLGLAIVRHLVELHGGTVEAESLGENQGSTFTITLPRIETPDPGSEETPASEQWEDLRGIRILVVDDDADTRDYIFYLLQSYGAIVTAVSSGAEALTTITQFKPDVLISDIGMPDMDGYMLIEQVRQLPPKQGGEVRSIALTAYASEIDYEKAIAAGFDT